METITLPPRGNYLVLIISLVEDKRIGNCVGCAGNKWGEWVARARGTASLALRHDAV